MDEFLIPQTSNQAHKMESMKYEKYEKFQHSPLNHDEPSIRLVQMLPVLSDSGHIQCMVSHKTVSATYTCLSYRWGNVDSCREILVNGRTATIRKNLYEFLSIVQQRSAAGAQDMLGPYWIDALSIDQTNTLERNHQVNQMGRIFENAVAVHLWLGPMPSSVFPLLRIIRRARHSSSEDREFVSSNKAVLAKHISGNAYWTRAWVTQEIVLNRNVTVWIGVESIGFYHLIDGLRYLSYQKLLEDGGVQSHDPFSRLASRWREGLRKVGLISLLADFHDKQCDNPLDRVYSLLSLDQEGLLLKVDYNISKLDLAVQVLRRCQKSLCLCSTIVVIRTLGLSDLEPPKKMADELSMPHFEFDVTSDMLNPDLWPEHFQCSRPTGPTLTNNDSTIWFGFHDTCESRSLADFRVACDNKLELLSRGQPSTERSPNMLLHLKEGFALAANEGRPLLSIRIAFWLLSRMFPRHVELCRHAKCLTTKSRCVLIDPPFVGYGTLGGIDDVRDLPGLLEFAQRRPPPDTSRLDPDFEEEEEEA